MVITNDKKKFKDIRTEEPTNEPIEGPQPVAVPFDISLLLSESTAGHNGYIDPSLQEKAEDVSFQNYIEEKYTTT